MVELTEQYRQTDSHFYFWNTIYSQWYTSKNQFEEDGLIYPNAEKYMMVQKAIFFNDDKIYQEMLKTNNPKEVKALGRKVKNFDEEKWNSAKEDIVTRGNYLKFTQNDNLLETLLEHKDLILVEASPVDKIWGIGLHFSDDKVLDESKWRGKNLLGKCIMKARELILKEEEK